MLYPSISNYLSSLKQNEEIYKYNEQSSSVEDELKIIMMNEAHAYNKSLTSSSIKDVFEIEDNEEVSEYYDILKVTDDGLIGYIEIPKINVKLPIYHGTSEEVLNKGVGHLSGSSLPVGGPNTHALLAGHRGLPSSKLFTDLDMIDKGDIFYIYVLDEKIVYKVDNISIINPDELDLLEIAQDDNVTLITCTPYAVNTQRLLVRGKRTEEELEEIEEIIYTKVSKESNILFLSLLGINVIELLILLKILIFNKKAD